MSKKSKNKSKNRNKGGSNSLAKLDVTSNTSNVSAENNVENTSKVYLYNISGIPDKSSAIIKSVGSIVVNDGDTIKDNLLHSIEIKQDVIGYTFLCNISDSFITSTTKYPVMYVIVDYNRSLLRCSLFKLYLYFTVTDVVSNENSLINQELKGEYTLEVCVNNCHKKLNKIIPVCLGQNGMVLMLEELLKSPALNYVINDLIDEVEETRKNQYGDMFEGLTIPKVTAVLKD